ncbi:MAG: ferrous iron transport protein B [Methanomicrobiales archaeon]|nr:ferrous iron transport protein B [Methanomicrobiales archaeon]
MHLALLGNPNVGKSLIFNSLTGLGALVSNYPGTTVVLSQGSVCYQHEMVTLTDLPGVYSLEGRSGEEEIVRQFLTRGDADALICVLDATHLERNLYLFLQATELAVPVVLVLNMIDEAERAGISIDTDLLRSLLGVPVIATSARDGRNIAAIVPVACSDARTSYIMVHYDTHIEAAVAALTGIYPIVRPTAIRALQGEGEDPELLDSAASLAKEIEGAHFMTTAQIVAANRHHCARTITSQVERKGSPHKDVRVDALFTTAFPGIPILIGILGGILLAVFLIGTAIERVLVGAMSVLLLDPISSLDLPPLLHQVAVSIVLAIQAGFGIALPFILPFFIFVSFLEDSGYLTRAAFLTDRAMHRLGLHGQAIIPLVLGLGCNVPALMSIGTLPSRRERVIASFLVTLVPCSARTVIIAGVLAAFVGIIPALVTYLLVLIVVVLTGLFLSRVARGVQFGLILEMAPLRWPDPRDALTKAWMRVREFFIIAMPLLIASSIVLGLLHYLGLIKAFQDLIAPFSTVVLGIPPYAITALIFGILRKEMAPETLFILAGTPDLAAVMTPVQITTFAVMSVLFIPCISTLAVLVRQSGLKVTLLVSFYTLTLGVLAGAAIHLITTLI